MNRVVLAAFLCLTLAGCAAVKSVVCTVSFGTWQCEGALPTPAPTPSGPEF
jgi:hypothetical protein